MKVYFVLNGSSTEEDRVTSIFSGHAGLKTLGHGNDTAEAMNIIKKDDPRTVVLDGNVFRGKGLDLILPILRNKKTSAAILLMGNGRIGSVTCMSLDLPNGSSDNAREVIRLLRDMFDECYA